MPKNEQENTEAILKAAAALADNLELTRADEVPVFAGNQIVLVASKFGIEFGIIKVHESTIREYRSTEYFLNGELLAKQVQKQTKDGSWVQAFKHKQTNYFPEGAVVYTDF